MTAATIGAIAHHPWLRRFGKLGFLFFLIKGLLWLAAPFIFYGLI